MKIQLLVYYHQNLEDLLDELVKTQEIELLIKEGYPVPDKKINYSIVKSHHIFNNKVFGSIYSLTSLLKNIDDDTDCVIIKHINKPDSIVSFIACKIKQVDFGIYLQRVKHLDSMLYRIFFKILILFLEPRERRIFSVTKEGYDEFKSSFENIEYIPLPIEESKFIKRNRKESKELKVLHVGKLDQRLKNQTLLIKSLENIRNNHRNIPVSLTLVGHIKIKNQYYSELIKLINICNLNLTIKKNLNYEDMKKLYHEYDLLVLPSTSETLGLVILEAMASGLPVIASNKCGGCGYIKHGINGYVFDTEKENDLQDKLENYINKEGIDWDKIEMHGNKSLEIIRNYHDPYKIAKRLTSFIYGGE